MRPASLMTYWIKLTPEHSEEEQEIEYYLTATDHAKRTIRIDDGGKPFIVKQTPFSRPFMTHTPPRTVTYDQDLELDLIAKPSAPITKAILCYRPLQRGTALKEAPMEKTASGFTGEIPKTSLLPGVLLYYFKLVAGESYVYPDPLETTPYYLIRVE